MYSLILSPKKIAPMKKNIKFVRECVSWKGFSTTRSINAPTIFLKEDAARNKMLDIPISKYAGETTVTMLTGSKVGEEGYKYINSIFQHIKAPINLECMTTSDVEDVWNEYLLSVFRNGTSIHIDTIHETKNKQKSLMMNTQLDLFACVVNCFSIPGYACKFPKIDIAIIMQNNSGDFSKLEYEPVRGVVETMRVCHKQALTKYIEFAFKYAIKHGRKKITFAHKSDILALSDGLHLEVAQQLHKYKYPAVEIDYLLINKLTKNLIINPESFDVLCLNDKYGTFVTSIVSGVCGGVGLFAASEIGDRYAIFKPLQAKLSITGKEELCPYGTILTTINLLKYLGYNKCAKLIWKSLLKVMITHNIKTREFGGVYTEQDVVYKFLEVLKESACLELN